MRTTKKRAAKQQLNLMCPIGGDTLGYISTNILCGFRDLDISTSLFPIMVDNKLSFNDAQEADTCSGAIKYSRQFNYKAPTLKIWHPHDLATKPGNGKYYAFIIPDSDYLTAAELHHINYTNGVFVNSSWAENILLKHKIKPPIYKVSIGVNKKIFNDNSTSISVDKKNYVFYSTGRWSLVNGHDFLIKAFGLAFNKSDNVQLRLLPTNDFLTTEETNKWLSLVDKNPAKDKIFLYNRLQTQYDMASFISDADCCLSMQRISSTCTSPMEAMAMNKPIIATNCGVTTELPDSEHFYKVDINAQEKAYDHRIMYGESNWAKLDREVLDKTIETMRYLYKNNITTNPDGLKNIDNYSWGNTCQNMANCMKLTTQP